MMIIQLLTVKLNYQFDLILFASLLNLKIARTHIHTDNQTSKLNTIIVSLSLSASKQVNTLALYSIE